VHRAKPGGEDRDTGDLARGIQAGIGEAADDHRIETLRLRLIDRAQDLGHGERRLIVALDAAGPDRRRRDLDLGADRNLGAQIGEPALDLGLAEIGVLLGGRELIENLGHRVSVR
jgi:hypothetical protein